MFLFHELHIDDDLLELRRDRRTYEAACQLIEAIVSVPESLGQRMALRFRHHFAQAALAFEGVDNALVRWEARGHEIGAHAHRRHIRTTRDALVAAGVRDLRAVVPGLIRCDRGRASRLVRACEGLGFDYISDQLQFGTFPYAGRVPWRPSRDLRGAGDGPFAFVDVSVNPFAWGLLKRDGDAIRQQFGLRAEHFERLQSQLDAWARLPATSPWDYFGYPFHEHQHTSGPESLAPDGTSLTAWHDWIEALDATVVLPRELADKVPGGGPQRPASRLDRRDLRHDIPSWIEDRLPRRTTRRPTPCGEQGALHVVRRGPEHPRLAIVVSHAGTRGGTVELLRPWGLTPDQLPDVAFWFWDRRGVLEPGAPHHSDELVDVFRRAERDGAPVGLLSYSAGVIPALRALDRVEPAFLIDTEGPSDRLSLVPRSDSADEAGHRGQLDDCELDAWEPFRAVRSLRAPYHRLQGAPDHMHGACSIHADVMVDAAGGSRHDVPGPIERHPEALRRLISEL